jgi:hypothetical protein
VHLADAVREQGQVTVVVEQAGLDPRDVRGEPVPVAERDELVLAAVRLRGALDVLSRRAGQ